MIFDHSSHRLNRVTYNVFVLQIVFLYICRMPMHVNKPYKVLGITYNDVFCLWVESG